MKVKPSIKAIIFDVDGTLYNAAIMRFCMAVEILYCLLVNRLTVKELRILKKYREEREKMNGISMEHLKTEHFTIIADKLSIEYAVLVKLIVEWMYIRPLKYMKWARKNQVKSNIEILQKKGVAVFFYSDYPLFRKMKMMGYEFDPHFYWSSLDKEMSAFKPNPKFLNYFKENFHFSKEEILFVGDREDRDKALADNFGCSYLDINDFDSYIRTEKIR